MWQLSGKHGGGRGAGVPLPENSLGVKRDGAGSSGGASGQRRRDAGGGSGVELVEDAVRHSVSSTD